MGGCGSSEAPPEGQEGPTIVQRQGSMPAATGHDYSFKILLIGDSGACALRALGLADGVRQVSARHRC